MRILVSAVCLALVSCRAAEPTPPPKNGNGRELSPPLTALRAWALVTEDGHGSCFPVYTNPHEGGGWDVGFVTAKHVSKPTFVKSPFYDPHDVFDGAVIQKHDHPKRDVSVVVAHLADAPSLIPLAASIPTTGRALWLAGYPAYPDILRITLGFAGSKPSHMTAPSFFGNSGGPVLLSTGEAVGILVAGIKQGNVGVWHMTFYEPLDAEVQQWIFTLKGG
jgi:hypothetical protein